MTINKTVIQTELNKVNAQIAAIEAKNAKVTGAVAKGPMPSISYETADRTKFPPRPFILDPFIRERSIGMIFSKTGSGKTVFTMNLCMRVARGLPFLGWKTTPKRIYYIDSEMEMDDMLNLRDWIKYGNELQAEDRISILNRSISPEYFVGTMSTAWQDKVFDAVKDYDLVVFDNLSTLFGTKSGDENKAESWEIIKDFLFRLRFAGKAVIFLHHAGKGGKQRGTSARVDTCDYVIRLDKEEASEGMALSLKGTFEKGRRGDLESFGANVHIDGMLERIDIQDDMARQIIERYQDGMSIDQVHKALDVPYRKVRKVLEEAKATRDQKDGAYAMWRKRR